MGVCEKALLAKEISCNEVMFLAVWLLVDEFLDQGFQRHVLKRRKTTTSSG